MADEPKPMTEAELATLLRQYAKAAGQNAAEGSEIAERRAKALEYYRGDVTELPSEEGWSSVTSRDLSEVLHWILPSLMRIFAASDNVVSYEARRPDAVDAAKQATDLANYVFRTECDGYRVLYSGIFDALLYGNGWLKVWFDPSPCYDVEDYSGLTDDEYMGLVSDDDVEVLQHSAEATQVEQLDPMTGAPVMVEAASHDVKIRRTTARGKFCIQSIPPEEIIIEDGAKSVDDVDYIAHRFRETRSNLIRQGYDEEIVKRASTGSVIDLSDEYLERHDEDDVHNLYDNREWASEEIDVYEHYIKVDFDGDGYAEWRKVVTLGQASERDIVDNSEWGPDHPFTALTPSPQPHRWEGRMLLDDLEDIIQNKTLLMRGINDNIALVNHPDMIASTAVANKDVLANPKPGRVVWVDGPAQGATSYNVTPFIGDKAFAVIQYMDELREQRTGVSRQSMALDPETLAKQTATAAGIQESASHAQNELRARNIAQYGGLTRLFRLLLKLIVRHQDKPKTIRLRGQFVDVLPRGWDPDMDVTISVGLGTGNRDKDVQVMTSILQKQEQYIQLLGMDNPLVSMEQVGNALTRLLESAGIRNPEAFFKEVNPQAIQQFMQAQQQQPNPEVQKAQMEMQMKQQQAQVDAQIKAQDSQAKLQSDRQIAMMKHEAELESIRIKAEIEREKLDRDSARAFEQMDREFALKRYEIDQNFAMRRELGTANVAASSVQMGGEPG